MDTQNTPQKWQRNLCCLTTSVVIHIGTLVVMCHHCCNNLSPLVLWPIVTQAANLHGHRATARVVVLRVYVKCKDDLDGVWPLCCLVYVHILRVDVNKAWCKLRNPTSTREKGIDTCTRTPWDLVEQIPKAAIGKCKPPRMDHRILDGVRIILRNNHRS